MIKKRLAILPDILVLAGIICLLNYLYLNEKTAVLSHPAFGADFIRAVLLFLFGVFVQRRYLFQTFRSAEKKHLSPFFLILFLVFFLLSIHQTLQYTILRAVPLHDVFYFFAYPFGFGTLEPLLTFFSSIFFVRMVSLKASADR